MNNIKSSIKFFFNILGFNITKNSKNINYLTDDLEIALPLIKANTMLPLPRLSSLYQMVRYCEENLIPGDYVECGVWKGGAMGLVALANIKHGKARRKLHLFDSFEEICIPNSTVDGARAMKEVERYIELGITKKNMPLVGIYDSIGGAGTLRENMHLLEEVVSYPKEFIKYHVGWFDQTIPLAKEDIQKIAILRLDGDWYESTKVCLDGLFEKVVVGGIVIIDDYGTYEGCKLAVDEFIANNKLKVYLSSVDSDCKYFLKINI
jgi:O-methyltransferase